jgi:hypothetical protein
MHAVYWLFTHPVNNFWLRHTNVGGGASGFFAFSLRGGSIDPSDGNWTNLRDQSETSPIVRAILALLALILLVASLVV